MNERSERDKKGKLRRTLYFALAEPEFFISLAGKSASEMNYSLTKQMFSAGRDGDEQLDIVKQSLLLSDESFLRRISRVWLRIHINNLCCTGVTDCNTNCSAERSHMLFTHITSKEYKQTWQAGIHNSLNAFDSNVWSAYRMSLKRDKRGLYILLRLDWNVLSFAQKGHLGWHCLLFKQDQWIFWDWNYKGVKITGI